MKSFSEGRTAAWVLGISLAMGGGCGDAAGGNGAGDDGASEADSGDEGGTANGDGGTDDGDETGAGDEPGDTGSTASRPNWHQDMAPLIAERCVSCHDGLGVAFDMSDYDETRPWAEVMALQTASGTMPPWHAVETDECEPPHAFEDDARLTADEIEMFADWAELGTPLGDPDAAEDIPGQLSTDLSDPSTTVTIEGTLQVEAVDKTLDFFHCLSFDPGNDEEVYVDGLQLIPGNDKITHHAVIYVDAAAASADWPGGVLEHCGGGAGVASPAMIGAWLPGARPIETPDDVGIRLPAGARIVVNMHYHADILGPQTDTGTGMALRWSTAVPPWVSEFRLFGNPGSGESTSGDFLIPADAVGHEETVEWRVPADLGPVRVWSVTNHMHKVGVDMKTSIVGPSDETCLVQTPRWDFNWQRIYEYDALMDDMPELSAGDTVRVRCTYDNVLDNPAVAAALWEVGLSEPTDVVEGDGTLDEMCVAALGLAVPS